MTTLIMVGVLVLLLATSMYDKNHEKIRQIFREELKKDREKRRGK